jgi:signal peptidase II
LRLAARRQGAAGEAPAPGHARALFWARVSIVVVAVLAIDRLTKHAVESSIHQGEERAFLPGVEIVHTRNDGVAFGLLGGEHVYLTVGLAVVVVLVLVIFALRVNRRPTRSPIWLPVGMIVGGALGNAIDRLRFGSVTDFIKLPLGWPPFNLADASITIGVIVLALLASRPEPPSSAER